MAKPFFEVFPELKVTEQLRELLAMVQVEKVTSPLSLIHILDKNLKT